MLSVTHDWRNIEDFSIGDLIHSWGKDYRVVGVNFYQDYVRLVYQEYDGKLSVVCDKIGSQFIARKRGY